MWFDSKFQKSNTNTKNVDNYVPSYKPEYTNKSDCDATISSWCKEQQNKINKNKFIPKKLSGYIEGQSLRCYDPDRNIVFSHQPYSMTNCGGKSYRISEVDYDKLSNSNSKTNFANSVSNDGVLGSKKHTHQNEQELGFWGKTDKFLGKIADGI